LSNIIALSIVSSYDIAKVKKDFTYQFVQDNPENFKDILYRFGMNVNTGFETQENVLHRTLAGDVVQGDRYVGSERIDLEWLASGYASREAKDRASGSKLLDDLYRQKGLH
jgi:hypothetical protein